EDDCSFAGIYCLNKEIPKVTLPLEYAEKLYKDTANEYNNVIEDYEKRKKGVIGSIDEAANKAASALRGSGSASVWAETKGKIEELKSILRAIVENEEKKKAAYEKRLESCREYITRAGGSVKEVSTIPMSAVDESYLVCDKEYQKFINIREEKRKKQAEKDTEDDIKPEEKQTESEEEQTEPEETHTEAEEELTEPEETHTEAEEEQTESEEDEEIIDPDDPFGVNVEGEDDPEDTDQAGDTENSGDTDDAGNIDDSADTDAPDNAANTDENSETEDDHDGSADLGVKLIPIGNDKQDQSDDKQDKAGPDTMIEKNSIFQGIKGFFSGDKKKDQ
ncbi:MAG: hypothetical protein K6G22_07065, partial [Lachnospiraceae bacterium]|nr:hypothetical protein [Lachnospiraceae bacterium]